MGLYTDSEHVIARSGPLLQGLGEESVPTIDALDGFIAEVEGEINGLIAGHGYATPVTTPVALEALAGVAGDGALILGLEARFVAVAGSANAEPLPLLENARARYLAALTALGTGKHAAIVALSEATQDAAGGSGAGSFWTDEAGFVPDAYSKTANPYTDPIIHKGMPL